MAETRGSAYILTMRAVVEFGVRHAAAMVVAVSVLALGVALTAEHGFGLEPCVLCDYQRWAYVGAGLLGLAAFQRRRGGGASQAVLLGLATLAFAAGAGLAGFHVGVEQQWWQGTAACVDAAGTPTTVEALRQQLMTAPVVRCDQVAWALFGVSIAGWNLLASIAFAAASLYAAQRLARGWRAA